MKQCTALITALALSGCSFAFVRGPGDVGNPPRVYAECTDSLVWPVVDGILGLSSIGVAFSPENSSTNSYGETESDRASRVTTGVVMSAAFIAGAIYGWTRVSACQEARSAYMASAPPPQMYPQQYPPPGYPPQQYPPPGYPPQQYPPQQYPPQQYPPPQPQQPQGPAAGMEGGMCMANNTCAPGLVCASGLCVRAPSGAPGAR